MGIPECGIPVDWWSFEFDRADVQAVSSGGTPYTRLVWTGMPRIPPPILDSIFYLYHSREDAEAGKNLGGTGFFLGVPLPPSTANYVYAVANWHVAVQDGASVIRVNKRDGGIDIFELDPSEWHFIPGGPDIAIADIDFDQQVHKIVYLHSNLIPRSAVLERMEIGVGEDIFMVGRFMDHDGGDQNVPAARFGHISVMPQTIKQLTGAKDRRSYILDVHSRSGYSGSPVFVYRTPGTDLGLPAPLMMAQTPYSKFICLLGIHWGQFPEQWEIQAGAKPRPHGALPVTANYVQGWSGMTLACPAEEIFEVLDMPVLKKVRDAEEVRLAALIEPKAEVAAAVPATDNPSHKEDFTRLLGAAAPPRKPAS